VRSLAQFLAPSVAAYLQTKIGEVAPRLTPGVRALAAGLARVSTQFGTREELSVDARGNLRRVVTALDFAGVVAQIPELTADAQVTFDGSARRCGPHHRDVARRPQAAGDEGLVQLVADRVKRPQRER